LKKITETIFRAFFRLNIMKKITWSTIFDITN